MQKRLEISRERGDSGKRKVEMPVRLQEVMERCGRMQISINGLI